MEKVTSPDNPLWTVCTGLLIVAALALSLICYYNTWETAKDLRTIATVGMTYALAGTAKFQWRKYLKKEDDDGST